MKIDVRINSLTPGEGNVKAIASANLDDCFAVKNIRVVEGKKRFVRVHARLQRVGRRVSRPVLPHYSRAEKTA